MSFSVAEQPINEQNAFKPLKNGSRDMTIVDAKLDIKDGRKTLKFTWQESTGKGKAWSQHIYDDEKQPDWLKTSRSILADLLWCFDVKGFKNEEEVHKMCSWLIGRSCIVRTKQETYDNKINVKAVSFYNHEKTNRAGMACTDLINSDVPDSDVPW